ncbi:M13 family metallopeptidase [Umboniibacter marinipuniceus]|uniref:Putative endopeptidase n=1 Tax=Umboniibacter marinipuniceus TaxID=569599 RepID=A0A3M0A9H1_9GAMM|nr:M13-type metalloendopeptidase [Umboniibacter marinipuniceus]RMA79478.1 putative endopeptidase [Umboniibacter marinipuniceus]
MKKLLLSGAIAMALFGCGETTTNSDVADQEMLEVTSLAPISGLDLDAMNLSIKPGDDFNAYVNGTWIESAEIPADRSSFGVFGLLRDQATADIRAIIEESAAATHEAGSDEQKVGDMYNAYTNWDARNALGISPLAPEFQRIANISSYSDLASYFAYASKYGVDNPLGMGQYVDFTDPNSYMVYAAQGGLGLPDREFYFNDGERSEQIRAAYVAHIEAMLTLADIENPASAAEMIMALETRLAAAHMKKEDARNMTKIYNPIPVDQLGEVMPTFDWDAYLGESGMADKIDNLVILSLDYSAQLDDILQDVALDDWKTYLSWKLVDASASSLTQAMDQQNFEFYSKTLRGVEEQEPMWKRGVGVVNGTLGEVVGKVYVSKHFPPAAKAKMETLVANLISAYEASINELDWMSAETKVQALDKLHKFTPKIGYPENWRDYSALDITGDNHFANIRNVREVNWAENIARQGGPVDRSEWGMTPQTVNAYYNPPLNEIVFPAAILQPPFFNLEADDAVNYGAIGAVIGHEIGHGFDDSGSTFDGDGVLRNWWTEADLSEFQSRTSELVAQYNGYYPFEDLHVNGEFTLGENIGDLGGLSIGLRAYEMSLNGNESPVIDGFTGVQRVFLGYAQVWRNKYRDEALRNLIETDPHSPSMYRVNGIVRNVPAFYDAFSVQPGDELYLAPEDRVKIW